VDRRSDTGRRALSELPAVHVLAASLGGPQHLAVVAARRAIDEQREAMLSDEAPALDVTARARELLDDLGRPSLRRAINATGVILHTNLGRAPLAAPALDAIAGVAHGYCNLELDLREGTRGSRHDHVERLLCELTGAEAAMVVNNGAAAVLLAVAALAGRDRGVVVSRGQLVEIGGGFRIPEVIEQTGARLIEVGTTNRTRLADYERVIAASGEQLGAILRVHQSNFRAVGFVEDVSVEALCGLGSAVIDDVGSGVLADATGIPALGEEPSLKRSVDAGCALVCCSGDKLLGGPQAGLLVGREGAVSAAREHPLARAMRIDKLSLAALQATLTLYREPERARAEIPVLAMVEVDDDVLASRAHQIAARAGARARIERTVSKVGGGALPLLELEGPAVVLDAAGDPVALARKLRAEDTPVIARINEDRVVLDPRTVFEDEVDLVGDAVRRALDELD
jgi:L-seryl-tRNA(Ser) seleniumtransferase